MSAERRAVAFVLLLLGLSSLARWLDRPRVEFPAAASLDLAAHEAAVQRNIAGALRRPLADGERIDPNTAPARELERLPRVGPALAARIIAAREEAPFRSADELRRVPGIGAALAASLAAHLDIAPVPGTAAGAGAAPAPWAGAARAADAVRADAGAGGAVAGVAINTATVDELVRLPGIGPVLAARIVAWRDSLGPFRNLDDVQKVPGIGPALRQRLEPVLRFVP